MKKKIIIISAILILLAFTVFPSCSLRKSAPPEWKTAYLDYLLLLESQSTYKHAFSLVYVDGDDIPELYIRGTCEIDGDIICSYKNGNIVEQHLERTCGGQYIERSGILINQNGHIDWFFDRVYTLDENGFSQILNADHTERHVDLENGKIELIEEYFIDDQPVSGEDYHSAVNAVFDFSKAVSFDENAVSYATIKQQISDCK